MAEEQTLADDIASIKSGVSGGIEEVPAPPMGGSGKPQDLTAETSIQEEAPAPSEEFSQEEFQPEQQEEFSFDQPKNFSSGLSKSALDKDYIQEIIESIIEEKWNEFVAKTGDFTAWKHTTSQDLTATKQEILRLRESFERLQHTMLGKTKEYGDSMKNIHSEMKALEKVFERILEPLTYNIKELQKLTDELKRK